MGFGGNAAAFPEKDANDQWDSSLKRPASPGPIGSFKPCNSTPGETDPVEIGFLESQR